MTSKTCSLYPIFQLAFCVYDKPSWTLAVAACGAQHCQDCFCEMLFFSHNRSCLDSSWTLTTTYSRSTAPIKIKIINDIKLSQMSCWHLIEAKGPGMFKVKWVEFYYAVKAEFISGLILIFFLWHDLLCFSNLLNFEHLSLL